MKVRCGVVTRVRGEQRGTTGVLVGQIDGGRGERERKKEKHALTRNGTEGRREHSRQHSKCEAMGRQSTRTLMYVYIYIYVNTVTTDSPTQRVPMSTHSHVHTDRRVRWRLCRKHTGVPRSRVGLPKTCAGKRLWRNSKSEGISPSPTSLRPH